MNYGRYSRSVTVLSEQGRDFAAGEGRVAGYLKIETGNNKGAIRCSVENLRPYPKGDYLYKLILFGNRGERTINAVVGTVPVGRSGNGEAYFRFNPQDVDGKGNPYEYFSIAIVASVSMQNEQEPLHPVLKGNTGNDPEEARPRAGASIREERENSSGAQRGWDNEVRAARSEPQDINQYSDAFSQGYDSPAELEDMQMQLEALMDLDKAMPETMDESSEQMKKAEVRLRMPMNRTGQSVEGQARRETEDSIEQVGKIAASQEKQRNTDTENQAGQMKRPSAEKQDKQMKRPSAEKQDKQMKKPSGSVTEQIKGEDPIKESVKAPIGYGNGAATEPTHPINRNQSGASERKKTTQRTFNRFYNEHVLHSCIHTCQVAEYYEEVKPFENDRTGARWKKIMNINNLPLVSPGAHYFASLYHHYLFGARPDSRGYASCYFFAVPGRRLETEQPDGGRSGFVYWQAMKGTDGQKTPYGYWIVEIDGQTGDIRQVSIEKNCEM